MSLITNITWILVIARWIIAIQLTRVALQQKLPNLFWLAAFFYITGIGDVSFMLLPITNLFWPFSLSVGLGEVMLVMFIQKTFYQDRKSPYLIFMAIALVFLVADLFFAPFLPYFSPFNWLWLIWVGYQAYKRIAADPLVEDWVKARYRLVIAYSLAALMAPFSTILFLMPIVIPGMTVLYESGPMAAIQMSILTFTTLGIVLEYLAWVMPKPYRRFLNRNYQLPLQEQVQTELSEEEIMSKLKARS